MYVLITYDVETASPEGQRRLRQVARECTNYGQRVQNSVFECSISPAQFTELRLRLLSIIDKKKDSIRFYFLGNNYSKRVEYIGLITSYNVEDELIV